MSKQLILVPRISTLPHHEAHARAVLRWLTKHEVVEAQMSTCGGLGNGMAYGLAAGARKVVLNPDALPFAQACHGLQFVTKRCIYTPTEDFLEEAGCPECRQEVGERLFDSLERWMPGETDNFRCPLCGYEDDINGFLFLQPCAFSNLALVFCGWAEVELQPSFVDALTDLLGQPLAQIRVNT